MPILNRLLRHPWTLSLVLLAVLPFSLWGAFRAFQSISNRVVDWMPADFQASQDFFQFFHLFGSDELLMISWDGCRLDDPRVIAYRDALLAPGETRRGPRPLFRKVITGADVLAMYRSSPMRMGRAEALEKMSGWIVSKDHQRTCVIALVATSERGEADRHAAVAHVRKAASRVPGLSPEMIRVAGSTIEGVAIDQASLDRLLPLNVASFTICLLIMACCLRSLRASFVILLIALFNEQLSMALIYYTGGQMNSILLLTANLTFVLTISMCVHWFNYYRDAIRSHGPADAPLEACRAAAQPTSLATLTTVLGLISLGISRIRPTVQFGIYSAMALILATAVVFLYASLHFQIWPVKLRHPAPSQHQQCTSDDDRGWIGFIRFIQWPVIFLTVTWLVVGFMGVTRLRTAVGLHELLPPRNPVVQDFVWLERNIGPLTPVEIVVEMPACRDREMLAQFKVAAALHEALQQNHSECALISAATFIPDTKGGLRQVARAAAVRRVMLQRRKELESLGYLLTVEDRNYWRLSMRAPSIGDTDYGSLLDDVRRTIRETLATQNVHPNRVLVCGAVPLVYEAQQQLLSDLIYSYAAAFALVSITLMILFRSILCGLICMIPNVLPSAIVFGYLGWTDQSIEFGTILTASAALGIAVDDSLHFITWFRRKIRARGTISEAVRYAYRRCAAAMVQTSLICGLGLAVFVFSPFSPIAYFGWCMFALILLALACDLVVLPCILLGPLGQPFLPRPARSPTTSRRVPSTSNTGVSRQQWDSSG